MNLAKYVHKAHKQFQNGTYVDFYINCRERGEISFFFL